jgi:DNA polymerase
VSGTDTEQLQKALVQQLDSLRRAGVTHWTRLKTPIPMETPAPPPTAASSAKHAQHQETRTPVRIAEPVKPTPTPKVALFGEESSDVPKKQSTPKSLPASATCENFQPLDLPLADRVSGLAALAERVKACTRCQELASTRTQTVFGVGNPQAKILFVGEAPGADEDAQGEPFVGKSGKLLTDIIKACRMKREDIYICNVLRCRPPGNRQPSPEEAGNCREYLEGQIAHVNPEYIVCWGACAAQNLLGTTESIGKLRGKFLQFGKAKVLCTYHPSYLLRNPASKKDVWEDMKFLFADMGVDLSAKA